MKNKKPLKYSLSLSLKIFFLLLIILIPSSVTYSQQLPLPNINIGMQPATTPTQIGLSLQVLLLITVLSLAPSIVIMTTSFIRLAIIFSFVRTALGTQNMPPNQVIMGLSLFLTFFIMAPTFKDIYDNAWKPYSQQQGKTPISQLYDKGITPLREFMFRQIERSGSNGIKTLDTFIKLSHMKTRPKNKSDVSTYVLIPAFMTNEITKAFTMGVNIFIPFLMIDLIVSSILMAMGMIMLPPVMVALPFKIILFVLVDGWNLVITSVVRSFS
jgi:flagellar biosynthetic protein FliP